MVDVLPLFILFTVPTQGIIHQKFLSLFWTRQSFDILLSIEVIVCDCLWLIEMVCLLWRTSLCIIKLNHEQPEKTKIEKRQHVLQPNTVLVYCQPRELQSGCFTRSDYSSFPLLSDQFIYFTPISTLPQEHLPTTIVHRDSLPWLTPTSNLQKEHHLPSWSL